MTSWPPLDPPPAGPPAGPPPFEAAGPAPPPRSGLPRWIVAVIGVLVLLLVLAVVVAVDQRRAADERGDRIRVLERQLSGARDPESGGDGDEQGQADGSGNPFEDLLEGLGGGGDLGGLGNQAGTRCIEALTGGGGLGGLEGLLGGESSGHASIEEVADATEELRQLQFTTVPTPTYLSPEQISQRAVTFVDEYPDAEFAADTRGLVALGALPRGADLEQLQSQALGDAVAGFYDTRTKELVVGTEKQGELDPMARVILSHELEHALADQKLGFPPGLDEPVPAEGTEDAALAALALIEGDASLTMQMYALRHLSLGDQIGMLEPAAASQRQLEGLPHFLQAALVFPYTEGMGFVCDIYAEGGWDAVNRAYDEPPTTTAQVLFPKRYADREAAVDPPDPPAPGEGWDRVDLTAFGAADLLWLLEAPAGDTDTAVDGARRRVEAWAGGELHVWGRGDATAAALALVQREGSDDLCETMKAWAGEAFTNESPSVVVGCEGDDVRVGVAPDRATAERLAGV